MSEIKVSVIMPVYNSQKYLRQCLDSVLAQTLREMEVICVDDGSTDDSPGILEEYAKKDSRVQVLHQQNKYAGVARNNGMARARGKYLVFWDSDDWFEKRALELLYRKCEEDKAQIGICAVRRYDQADGISYPAAEYFFRERVPQKKPFNKYDTGRYLFNFSSNVPWNKMFLRSFVETKGLQFQALPQGNDLYFVMMALFLADSITVVDRALINYRVSNASSITGKSDETVFSSGRAFSDTYEALCRCPEFDDIFRQSFANKAIGPLLNILRQTGDMNHARSLFEYYKEDLFPKIGLYGQPEEFFNSREDYEAVLKMQDSDCETFLLYQLRVYYHKFLSMRGRYRNVKSAFFYRVGDKIKALPRRLKRTMKLKRK